MKRLGALLLFMGASGCNAQEWNFSDDAGASAADATGESSAPAADASNDATVDVGSPHKGDEGGTSLGRCETESECARLGLHCILVPGLPGACVPCLSDADCLQDPARPRCDAKLNRCVECESAADCQANYTCVPDPVHRCEPICPNDTVICPAGAAFCVSGMCLACRVDSASDCRRTEVCDPLTGRCGECVVDADCRSRLFPKCDRTTSICVQCLHNSDCGRGACSQFQTCIGLGGIPWWDE